MRRSLFKSTAVRLVAIGGACLLSIILLTSVGLTDDSQSSSSSPYNDVGKTHTFRDDIATLTDQGIFTGTDCGEEKFCPSQSLKRWQMAVWVVRAVDGRDPLPVQESRFTDVDNDAWWMPYVERLADLGITRGCSVKPLKFCPDSGVTRQQMASFLARAFRLPAAEPAGFKDVSKSNSHFDDINRLYATKITSGCNQSPLRYCPAHSVSKGQMAAFLNRGLKWQANNNDDSGTRDNELSRWVKSAIVDEYGSKAPWLREVWNYTDQPGFSYNPSRHPTSNALASMVWYIKTDRNDVFPQVKSYGLYADRGVIGDTFQNPSLIHELAHIYTIDGYNAAKNPEAIAAGWLYFDSIAGSYCDPLELYAETAEALEPFDARELRQIWWRECPNLPSVPTDEAVEVVSQAFSGRLPDWFYDKFQKDNKKWDYQKIWREVKYSSPDVRRIVVPMLRNSFGGYCSEEAVRQTLFASERRPHLTQPWRNGGCEELKTSKNSEFITEENELSLWVKGAVIDKYGDKWPWLKEAWDYTNRPNFKYLPTGESGDWKYPYQYIWAWRQPEETGDVFELLASDGLSVAKNTIKNNYLHEPTYELARMYIHNYDLAKNPEAVVAGWLYFDSIAGFYCNAVALYIDTVTYLEPDFRDREYWWEWEWTLCPDLPDQPTDEAREVVRQILSGQTPDWFYDNFQKENGQWEYQKIWEAATSMTTAREMLLPMLRHSFGGYCSEQTIADANYLMSAPFIDSDLTQTRMIQPWQDGGCGQKLKFENNSANKSPAGGEYATEENELSRWVKNDVVNEYNLEAPWLREAWDYTNSPNFQYVIASQIENSLIGRIFQIGSARHSIFTIGEDTLPRIRSQKIYVSEYVLNKPTGLFYPVSELAYVYIINGAEVAKNPEAVAAGWLYFASLMKSESAANCDPLQLYADTATFIEPFSRTLNSKSWSRCPHLPSKPTAEAKRVVSQAFSGQIPDWFYDNFQKKNGQWDHRKIWTAVRNSPTHAQIVIVQTLQHSFGGYCSEEDIRDTLFVTNPQPPLTQPWRNGGC